MHLTAVRIKLEPADGPVGTQLKMNDRHRFLSGGPFSRQNFSTRTDSKHVPSQA